MQPQQPYAPPPPQQPLPGPNMGAQQPPAPNYEFIMNPEQPKRPPLFNFSGAGAGLRIAVVAGGIILLLVIFVGVKNMLAGSNKSIPSLVSVAQDQQELAHLATNGVQNVTDGNLKNFAITAQVSLQSEKSQLVTYLATNHRKVSAKELNLKKSKTTDEQLSAAGSASNYDATFKQVMQAKLTSYKTDLSQAYNLTKGPKGRALLSGDYDAVNLLLKQLGS